MLLKFYQILSKICHYALVHNSEKMPTVILKLIYQKSFSISADIGEFAITSSMTTKEPTISQACHATM